MPKLEQTTTVRLGDGVFKTRVASTSGELERGLSRVEKLAPNQGMLFVFRKDAPWAIWMKDMKIPIDIIWLDQNKTVVHIVQNAQPEGYPQEKFIPKSDARYVFEAAAGTVKSREIRVGNKAVFSLASNQGWKR
ncbi:hypothetical protein B7Z28_00930 [Candidatus Saccharibacteria bacterium 32-45-3]|nr:MAG: hypothetical protein B7Z28_00930 [Candidatus Saccharibacteria bacterium 32-45-3]